VLFFSHANATRLPLRQRANSALMPTGVVAKLQASGVMGSPPQAHGRQENMRKSLSLVLLSSLVLTAGWASASHAATSATLDILPNDVAGAPADRVEVGKLKPLGGQNRSAKALPGGNPLWSIPLSILTATQERPIFSTSRRPPPRAVAGPVVEPVNAPVLQKSAEPERPPLALIGAVVGESDAIAVFLDRTNLGIVRLRAGEMHGGWVLSSILRREVTLKKADQTEVLALQRPEVSTGAAGNPGSAGIPGLPIQPAQAIDNTGYVPFVPRSTPKNGESDGL
jgi:general secretion pathway protein N